MRKIVFILIIVPSILYGQTATFSADTTRFYKETNSEIYAEIMEAEWIINGQTLRYGSKPITVKTDNILDTILYRKRTHSQWDTIICNINQSGNFQFIYNECCGGFNIADESGKFIEGSVIFKIKGKENNKLYLGTLDDDGLLVNTTTKDTLKFACRSLLHPNIYQITFKEIEICKDTIGCPEEVCLYEKGKDDLDYGFGYKTISLKLDFLFLPLSNQPITIIYDPKTDKIRIE